MNDSQTISDRIKLLVTYLKNGNNTAFAKELEISEGSIRSYQRGIMPKGDVLQKIVTKYEVNARWLLTGEGPMLHGGTETTSQPDTETHEKACAGSVGDPAHAEKGGGDTALTDLLREELRERNDTIRRQAEEIGMLKATNASLRERNASLQSEVELLKNTPGISVVMESAPTLR